MEPDVDQVFVRLDPQLTTCIKTLKCWESVHEKKHADADSLITVRALEEADDQKAKEWLEVYNKTLDTEVTKEVHRRLVDISKRVAETAKAHPGYLYHYDDDLVAKCNAFGAAIKRFLVERMLSHCEDAERLGKEVLDAYACIQPLEVIAAGINGDHVFTITAPSKPN